jgi:hypothetical protein
MDGIFIAHHNTQNLIGFQYLKNYQLDQYVFGSHYMGIIFFNYSLSLLEVIIIIIELGTFRNYC